MGSPEETSGGSSFITGPHMLLLLVVDVVSHPRPEF